MNIWSKEHNAKKQSILTVKTIIKTTSMLDAKKAWQEKDDKRNKFFFSKVKITQTREQIQTLSSYKEKKRKPAELRLTNWSDIV